MALHSETTCGAPLLTITKHITGSKSSAPLKKREIFNIGFVGGRNHCRFSQVFLTHRELLADPGFYWVDRWVLGNDPEIPPLPFWHFLLKLDHCPGTEQRSTPFNWNPEWIWLATSQANWNPEVRTSTSRIHFVSFVRQGIGTLRDTDHMIRSCWDGQVPHDDIYDDVDDDTYMTPKGHPLTTALGLANLVTYTATSCPW